MSREMKVVCFSSFTLSYLNRARVLFKSLREWHPEWRLVALITDKIPSGFEFNAATEPFDEVVWAEALGIEPLRSWLFKHDVVEACTAVKGPYLSHACRSGADIVIYLDPDTCLFNRLDPVIQLLETNSIILTPHQLEPEDHRRAIVDNEVTSLKTGIYNLGFVAVRSDSEGRRFADWWRDRLLEFCYDDICNGLFVDQRWCDHVPSFFDRTHILRDPGYNVASWNLSRRRVSIDEDGAVRVNGALLRFWHFTKLGPLGDVMTKRYAEDNFEVYELWNWYRKRVAQETPKNLPQKYWAWGIHSDGEEIFKGHRLLYRDRCDLQLAFPDPYAAEGYRTWLRRERLFEWSGV